MKRGIRSFPNGAKYRMRTIVEGLKYSKRLAIGYFSK
jgi:hypothetical protein